MTMIHNESEAEAAERRALHLLAMIDELTWRGASGAELCIRVHDDSEARDQFLKETVALANPGSSMRLRTEYRYADCTRIEERLLTDLDLAQAALTDLTTLVEHCERMRADGDAGKALADLVAWAALWRDVAPTTLDLPINLDLLPDARRSLRTFALLVTKAARGVEVLWSAALRSVPPKALEHLTRKAVCALEPLGWAIVELHTHTLRELERLLEGWSHNETFAREVALVHALIVRVTDSPAPPMTWEHVTGAVPSARRPHAQLRREQPATAQRLELRLNEASR